VLIDGACLGLFDRDGLAMLDELHYETLVERTRGAAFSYDDETWNTSGLQPWEAAIVDAHFPAGGRVIVTGAGGGREVLALTQRGFDAVGYEPHPGLVRAGSAILAAHGTEGRLRASARDVFPDAEGGADAVLVGWSSYMLIPGRQRRVAFLRAARARLAPGAPILVSFFVRSASERDYHRVAAIANVVRRVRGAELAQVGDTLRPNFVHAFAVDEIREELAAGCFELATFHAEPYGHAVARAT
jgi:hypothetical protein